jgi:hypothetical protein
MRRSEPHGTLCTDLCAVRRFVGLLLHTATMSDAPVTQKQDQPLSADPQAWTVRDLRAEVERLHGQLATASERIKQQLTQLSIWTADLPAHHEPDPQPVRLADLASTELTTPLSLARRLMELTRLLDRADDLAGTLMDVVAIEATLFAPRRDSASELTGRIPALIEDDARANEVSVMAHCHSPWGDDDVFEKQRRAVRQIMAFDGNRTWHGTLTSSVNDNLPGWQTLLTAAEAGAHVEVQGSQ